MTSLLRRIFMKSPYPGELWHLRGNAEGDLIIDGNRTEGKPRIGDKKILC